ncbi:hypothetical protein SLEP1_g49718 [Rubroshorea leprosula]|uniref:Uncharacterized protein n=1 Tax=Rubroshorea leprosula TaxID=152421 RepID=A0AAV5LXQ2_9ROSI|nr:hypothetical protein SLEP1_g49718 [Rubroshorea leprosula]
MRERGRVRERGGDFRTRERWTAQSREHGRSSWKLQQRRMIAEGKQDYQVNQNQARRRKLGDSYDWGLYKQATPFFFTNFTEEWSHEDMWRTFMKYGRVFDIYSPPRRSRNGSRFGFVRFLGVKDRKELERKLDNIWIGDCKLWVNYPRYNDIQQKGREIKTSHVPELQVQNRSYAEVVKGHQTSRHGKGDADRSRGDFGMDTEQDRKNVTWEDQIMDKKKIWVEKGKKDSWAGFEYNTNKEESTWLEGCYVGTTHSVEMVRNLQEKFYMEGYFTCRVRAMGGKLVLMDCEDKEELKDLVESASEWLGQWFEKVCPWSPELVAKERFVWIRCQGVPLNVWGPGFFESMGCSWGKFICLDDSTSQRRRFDIARFLISTPIMNSISVSREIKINGSLYTVKFSEEEFSNSFFSLKQDFLPHFQSDSEEHESWSIGSETEDYGCEKAVEEDQGIDISRELELEDDDVDRDRGTLGGMSHSHVQQEEEETVERVADSLECFQNSNGELIRKTEERVVQEAGGDDMTEVSNEGRSKRLGLEKKTNLGHRRQPTSHTSSPNLVISTNMGLGISRPHQTEGVNSSSANKSEYSGNRGSATVVSEEEMGDHDGQDRASKEDLMKRTKRGKEGFSQKRKKKIRLCSSVYLTSRSADAGLQRGKNRGRQNKKPKEGKMEPKFIASQDGDIAGGSVGDSGIQNCNQVLRKQLQTQLAKDIWDLAKRLGATAENDEEILQKINEMEGRDKQSREDLVRRAAVETKRETKAEVVNRSTCRSIWGTDEFEWIFKPSVGLSGGLLCVWSRDVLKKTEVIEGKDFIGVFGEWGEDRLPVYILNIYSSCHLEEKRALWKELLKLITSRKGNWCLGGDFNAARKVEDRAGCRGTTREMREFESFIQEAGLVDLPLVGRRYTWHSANGQHRSRIDRFLLSEDWMKNWSDLKQWGLGRTVSDHCPLLLKNEKVDWGPKPFKFFDAWLEYPDCKQVISQAWNSEVGSGWMGFRLKEKLKKTKKALKEWSANNMADVDRRIAEAEKNIAEMDRKEENSQLTADDIEIRRSSFLDLWKNMRIKESMLQQKSRKMWLKEGDANTKFYHRSVKGRWRRNEINSIQINGEQCRGVSEIREGVVKYFKGLFTEEEWQRPKLDGINFRQLADTDNDFLMAKFTEEEIQNAVWDCDSTKSPGPDGFNFRVIKIMWEEIKQDVIGFVQEFHENGKIVRGSNSSFITLIPKVENPQRIEEYRPISLIGVMYKILAKLLANRLRKVLGKIIGEQQMAFIEGRQLMDGVVIANEVIDEAKRKRIKSFLFKVDFEKAYDKVSWDFVDYMLMRTGFTATWRKWIKECFQSSMISILVNGSPTKQFSVNKGIRQGDPLSPFLFLLVAEGLNGLMQSALDKDLYKGVRIGNGNVVVSHLQFADDTIFFGEASEENIQAIKCIMRTFELASGLKINFGKSQLMEIGTEEGWKERMAYRLCCKGGELPFKYLGIPIGGNHRKLAMWKPLMESFKKKLASWKGQNLSLGGRITLLNSVLSSLPVYLMSAYKIPKGILYSLDKIRRNFLWGGSREENKIKWVSWERVCRKKVCGGLGVKNLRKFNLALMGKWWGRLAKGEEGLWGKVIKGKYGGNGGQWMSWVRDGRRTGSLWWRDIQSLNVREDGSEGWLTEGFRIKIGEGKGVSFWWDEWCGEDCLANIYPRLYVLSTGKEKDCQQMGEDSNGTWKWNMTWRRALFQWEEEAEKELRKTIDKVKISPGCADRWEWIHSVDGQYSTSTAYAILAKQGRDEEEEKMSKREEEEDSSHLFLNCLVAQWLWKACAKWWGITIILQKECRPTFQHLGEWTKKPHKKEGWDCIWNALLWTVWMARNKMLFDNAEINNNLILIEVKGFSLWWRDIQSLNVGEDGSEGWLTEGFRIKIGEGKGVSFWWDEWCGEDCLANIYPRLYVLSTGKEKDCQQMGEDSNGTWKWNMTWRRALFQWEEEAEKELRKTIDKVKISPGCADRWEWIHSVDGQYSTSTAYAILAKQGRDEEEEKMSKRVWNPTIPSKVAAFNWKVLMDRIPTRINLFKRGILKDVGEKKCILCKEEEEDSSHLFLNCLVAQWLWKACAKWWGITIILQKECRPTFQHLGEWTKKPHKKEGWDCIWNALLWTVWMARNKMLFDNAEVLCNGGSCWLIEHSLTEVDSAIVNA